MGKSSISDFVQNYLSNKFNIACVYTSNKGNDSVSILTSNILVSLLDNVPEESRIDKLKTWFGNHGSL